MIFVDPSHVRSMMDMSTVVIHSGEQDVRYPFWLRWSGLFQSSKLDFKDFGVVKQYCDDITSDRDLQGHAKLLSINGFTVCLLRPIGQFADHDALLECVKDASGIYSSDRVSDEVNYRHVLSGIFKESTTCRKGCPRKPKLLDDAQQKQLQEVDFIIKADGEFIERDIEERLRRDEIHFRVIDELAFPYTGHDAKTAKKVKTCAAHCQFAVVNSIVFAFANNSGNYSDAKKLQKIIPTWFPKVQEILPEEQAVHYFSRIYSHELPPLGPKGMKLLQDPVKAQAPTLQATILPPAAEPAAPAAESSSVQANEVTDEELEDSFTCCITLELMENPYVDHEGNSFEYHAIMKWIAEKGTSPKTGKPLKASNLQPNVALKKAIQAYKKMHSSKK